MRKIEVEIIKGITEWVRDTEVGQMRIGILAAKRHGSFNSTVCRLNGVFRELGEDKWVMHWVNGKQDRVAIFVLTIAEGEKTKVDINEKDKYEEKLPKGFHNREQSWAAGTWHG